MDFLIDTLPCESILLKGSISYHFVSKQQYSGVRFGAGHQAVLCGVGDDRRSGFVHRPVPREPRALHEAGPVLMELAAATARIQTVNINKEEARPVRGKRVQVHHVRKQGLRRQQGGVPEAGRQGPGARGQERAPGQLQLLDRVIELPSIQRSNSQITILQFYKFSN
ncbi:Hypothetical_protein [Hexamita inflata]|uniref:Hypothetical_protein n=1 Tax=Hexamita inflata TaxID=28002 RepID=A0AA86R803_9EUKA|nr:Hypothetical protein HINF_LOCUS59990 [Hexamita inflata]